MHEQRPKAEPALLRYHRDRHYARLVDHQPKPGETNEAAHRTRPVAFEHDVSRHLVLRKLAFECRYRPADIKDARSIVITAGTSVVRMRRSVTSRGSAEAFSMYRW